MGKSRARKDSRKPANGQKEVTSEVFQSQKAANRLGFDKQQFKAVGKDNKTRNRLIDKGKVARKKSTKKYTEEELGIPKLNLAVNPVGIKKSGKKGKVFTSDSKMALILAEVTEQASAAKASKLERARHIEAIREEKRKEIEQREQAKEEKLENKKAELKKRRKTPKVEEKPAKTARRVRFA